MIVNNRFSKDKQRVRHEEHVQACSPRHQITELSCSLGKTDVCPADTGTLKVTE